MAGKVVSLEEVHTGCKDCQRQTHGNESAFADIDGIDAGNAGNHNDAASYRRDGAAESGGNLGDGPSLQHRHAEISRMRSNDFIEGKCCCIAGTADDSHKPRTDDGGSHGDGL